MRALNILYNCLARVSKDVNYTSINLLLPLNVVVVVMLCFNVEHERNKSIQRFTDINYSDIDLLF